MSYQRNNKDDFLWQCFLTYKIENIQKQNHLAPLLRDVKGTVVFFLKIDPQGGNHLVMSVSVCMWPSGKVAFHNSTSNREKQANISTDHCQPGMLLTPSFSINVSFFIWGTISGSQGRKESVSWCLNPYQVECMCLSGSQDFIHLQCDHQEMPGKCFNLPTIIRNASTLNQPAQISSQSKYSTCFLARPPQWVCTALSLFLFAPKLFGIDPK